VALETLMSLKCPLCFLRKDRLEIREPNHAVKVKVVFFSRGQYNIRLHLLRIQLCVALFIFSIILTNSSQQNPSQEAQAKIFSHFVEPFCSTPSAKEPAAVLHAKPDKMHFLPCPPIYFKSNVIVLPSKGSFILGFLIH
jgi:hypothetical protein